MFVTRALLEILSREELIYWLLQFENLYQQQQNLDNFCDKFVSIDDPLRSQLQLKKIRFCF